MSQNSITSGSMPGSPLSAPNELRPVETPDAAVVEEESGSVSQ